MLKDKKIIVYSLPTCGMCMMLKNLLTQKNIPFTTIMDVNKLNELGINHVPVLEIDGQRYENFKEILNIINKDE